MAYTTINKSTEHFNTVLYSGDDATTRNITGFGFQPDWIWNKARSAAYNHYLIDSLRGSPGKVLISNLTNAEDNDSGFQNSFKGFVSDGNTIGQVGGYEVNDSGVNYVQWGWKAGTTGSGTSTGSGTGKAYSYSVNTTAAFSIVKYKGNGTAGHTIPHHLGTTPDIIIAKRLSAANNWSVYHKDSFVSQSDPGVLYLNTTAGKASDVNVWGNSSVTINSTVFSLGDYEGTNYNDSDYIAYCFTEKTGYSKFGKYTGNGSSSSPMFIYTGFKPKFVIVKNTSQTDEWFIHDDKRDGFNDDNEYLFASVTNVEGTNVNRLSMYSNGFSVPTTDKSHNANGNNYVYIAFGQSLVGSNNIPCTAR